MKTTPRILIPIVCFAGAVLATPSFAEPIDYSEVSLLVRAHESAPSIVQEVSRRKLVRALTPQQENTLKKQGAPESLIQTLRRPDLTLATADASAFEARREQARNSQVAGAPRAAAAVGNAENNIDIFEVSPGHPINLSQWGGPDFEFAFRPPTRLDEGCPDAVVIDNFNSFTHTATYLGAGRPDDSTTIFDRRNYVSIMDHSFTRGLRIDRNHPVQLKGVPYILYPVYAAGGVSLYYIGSSSSSVKLAVSRTP
jgi:hypothetical protein